MTQIIQSNAIIKIINNIKNIKKEVVRDSFKIMKHNHRKSKAL